MLTDTRPAVPAYDTLKLDPAGRERRRGLRIRQERSIKAFIPSAARFVGGRTHDISATGLRLEMPRSAPLQPGAMLHVHVDLAGGGSTLVHLRQMLPARIVWVDRNNPNDPTLIAGVEFLASIALHADAA